LLASAVLFAPLDDVVFRNLRDLQYHPGLIRDALLGAAGVWVLGFIVLRRTGDRWPARVWLLLPWAVLLFDVLAGAVEPRGLSPLGAVAIDLAIAGLLVLGVVTISARSLRAVAAASGLLLAAHTGVSHVVGRTQLTAEDVVGANREPVAASVDAAIDRGNVYHLLLDAYQSESFADSTKATASSRFPGFTYYTRFNTNFPRTSSAEPALIHGRLPRPGLDVARWADLAVAEGFWSDLTNAGVGVWVYPYGRWLCPHTYVKCVASSDLARDAGSTVTRDETLRVWAMRLLPLSLRARLSEPAPASAAGSLPLQYFNLKQFDELLADEEDRPARGQYVYYHALIPHHDHIMNERCELVEPKWDADGYWGHVACANVMVERLAATLRRLGRLDDALIVVHADHGAPEFLVDPAAFGRRDDFPLDDVARRYQAVDLTYHDGSVFDQQITRGDSARWRSMAVEVFSSGLLLVKHAGARTYTEDATPVQLLDIAPTVLTHFGVSARSYPGTPLRLAPDAREQVFYAHSRDFDGKLSAYRLAPAGWTFVEDIPVASSSDD
jgi:hypothetical protein